MVEAVTINLITQNPDAHGAFDTVTETSRTVFATVKSVTRNEYYLAASAGLSPEIVFELSDYSEYSGERLLVYDSVRYRVIRTYRKGMTIELTAEKEKIE